MSVAKDLIAILESSKHGSKELDEEIAGIIVGAVLERQRDGRAAWHRDGFWVSVGEVKSYTTSIDVALQLLPRGLPL